MLDRISTWLEMRLGPVAFRRALDASLCQRDYQGESLRDLGAIRTFLGGGIATLFDVPWVPIYLGVVYMLHPVMGHVALAGAVILFLLALASDLAARRPLKEANRSATRSMRTVDGALRNAEVIDAMGLTDGVLRRWAGLSREALVPAVARERPGRRDPGRREVRPALRADGDSRRRRLAGDPAGGERRRHDRRLDHHGTRAGPGRAGDRNLEADGPGPRSL